MELKEKLILEITKASVAKSGVDSNSGVVDMHSKAIVDLANAILKKLEEKK